MPRRILVLSASVGAGHLRAAEAVELALRRLDPAAIEVNNVATLPYKLDRLLGTSGRLAELTANAKRLGGTVPIFVSAKMGLSPLTPGLPPLTRKSKQARLGRPRAAFDVAQAALDWPIGPAL